MKRLSMVLGICLLALCLIHVNANAGWFDSLFGSKDLSRENAKKIIESELEGKFPNKFARKFSYLIGTRVTSGPYKGQYFKVINMRSNKDITTLQDLAKVDEKGLITLKVLNPNAPDKKFKYIINFTPEADPYILRDRSLNPDLLKILVPEKIDVTGIAKMEEGVQRADFTLISKITPFSYLYYDQSHLNELAKLQSRAYFRKYDDGWRLFDIELNLRPLDI